MTATRAYLVATLAGPLVILATIALPPLLIRNQAASSLEGRTLAVVAAESLLPAVRAEFAPLGVALEEVTDDTGLGDRVRAGDLHGYVVFSARRARNGRTPVRHRRGFRHLATAGIGGDRTDGREPPAGD